MKPSPVLRAAVLAAAPVLLTACAVSRPPPQVQASAPSAWQAPLPSLPHGGSVDGLLDWWRSSLDDALLTGLIADAQALAPSVAQAGAQLAQVRAQQVAARSALLPGVDAQASASRGFNEQLGTLASVAQVGAQAAWELDVFGGNAAQLDAARARGSAAAAQWHEARVAVAAEVAQHYSAWQTCQRQLAVAEADAHSRGETARLSVESERAGFTAPATAALATASHADARARVAQQRLQCEIGVKTLVALSGRDETLLRTQLAAAPPLPATGALFALPALPAQLLAQRPDVYAAEREVAAASAEVGAAEAARYPRLQLLGSIGAGTVRTGVMDATSTTWSIGPVALSVPLFDAGRRAAQAEAAQARYELAASRYRAVVRQAVAEVEQGLARLASTAERAGSAQQAAAGYRRSFEATQARWQAGLASLVELEDARRMQLASETALVALEHERLSAWIALYRAAGGGWTRALDAPVVVGEHPHPSPLPHAGEGANPAPAPQHASADGATPQRADGAAGATPQRADGAAAVTPRSAAAPCIAPAPSPACGRGWG
ncbi:efflux transporter outer membrane subunit [Melaminivora jejuensis]|uniref:efflux transporter outer membrane subunit n=1 Tax=Melaminivora jejuensis TaxID=1267217 RepID=UPI001AE0646F|nr:efflux transporter outer membrane subunit [Melaminivora jejuensis]UHJ64762.1 efflux transporter outer membrane subunit [Melaminivora jejuensis]